MNRRRPSSVRRALSIHREKQRQGRFMALYEDAGRRQFLHNESVKEKRRREVEWMATHSVNDPNSLRKLITPHEWTERWEKMVACELQSKTDRQAIRRQLDIQRKLETMKECTFTPKIHTSPATRQLSRSLQQSFSDEELESLQTIIQTQRDYQMSLASLNAEERDLSTTLKQEQDKVLQIRLKKCRRAVCEFLGSAHGRKVHLDRIKAYKKLNTTITHEAADTESRKDILRLNTSHVKWQIDSLFDAKRKAAKLHLTFKRLEIMYELTRLENHVYHLKLSSCIPQSILQSFDTSLIDKLKSQKWYQSALRSDRFIRGKTVTTCTSSSGDDEAGRESGSTFRPTLQPGKAVSPPESGSSSEHKECGVRRRNRAASHDGLFMARSSSPRLAKPLVEELCGKRHELVAGKSGNRLCVVPTASEADIPNGTLLGLSGSAELRCASAGSPTGAPRHTSKCCSRAVPEHPRSVTTATRRPQTATPSQTRENQRLRSPMNNSAKQDVSVGNMLKSFTSASLCPPTDYSIGVQGLHSATYPQFPQPTTPAFPTMTKRPFPTAALSAAWRQLPPSSSNTRGWYSHYPAFYLSCADAQSHSSPFFLRHPPQTVAMLPHKPPTLD